MSEEAAEDQIVPVEDTGAPGFDYSTAKLSFDGLDPTDFEELCFELLQVVGYANVDWRKGTPKASSPSDRGRTSWRNGSKSTPTATEDLRPGSLTQSTTQREYHPKPFKVF